MIYFFSKQCKKIAFQNSVLGMMLGTVLGEVSSMLGFQDNT